MCCAVLMHVDVTTCVLGAVFGATGLRVACLISGSVQ